MIGFGAILLALVAGSMPPPPQSAPQTFAGPGYYCGGGFLVRLEAGERVTFAPPEIDMALISIDLAGHRVDGTSGGGRGQGRIVRRISGGVLRQAVEGGRITYTIDDRAPLLLRLSSRAFRGYPRDGWFFSRVNFDPPAERRVACLRGGPVR
jgi:hypothetical protein